MSQSYKNFLDIGAINMKSDGIFHFGDASDGFDLQWDGTNTLNIDGLTANDTVRFGEVTATDVQMDGATDLLWDSSAGSLTNGGFFAGFYPSAAIENITAGTGGAINVTSAFTTINTDGGGDAYTLADGTVVGQIKNIFLLADGGGAGAITPANYADGTSITFDDAGDHCSLLWDGTNWRTIFNLGGTIA